MISNNLMSGFISCRMQTSRQLPSRSRVKLNLQPSTFLRSPAARFRSDRFRGGERQGQFLADSYFSIGKNI